MKYAVEVEYTQCRVVMVDATTPKEAAIAGRAVVMAWPHVISAKPITATESRRAYTERGIK